ncbi:MAG: AAA family ATPase, partial [Burkholderiaceae bacterium]
MTFIPPRVACLSQKGGGGKTTMATNLAVAAVAAGVPTLLLDLDPQQSSVRAWASWRAAKRPRTKAVLAAQAVGWDNLAATLTAAGLAPAAAAHDRVDRAGGDSFAGDIGGEPGDCERSGKWNDRRA